MVFKGIYLTSHTMVGRAFGRRPERGGRHRATGCRQPQAPAAEGPGARPTTVEVSSGRLGRLQV